MELISIRERIAKIGVSEKSQSKETRAEIDKKAEEKELGKH